MPAGNHSTLVEQGEALMLKAAVLYAITGLTPCWADRGDIRKPAQLETIAEAITVATERARWRGDRMVLAALLITIAWHESKFCLAIHEGKPGMAGALTIFQIERGSRLKGYRAGLDLDSTISAATAAADLLSRSHQCGESPISFFRAYTSAACDAEFPTLHARVRTFHVVFARLVRAGKAAA